MKYQIAEPNSHFRTTALQHQRFVALGHLFVCTLGVKPAITVSASNMQPHHHIQRRALTWLFRRLYQIPRHLATKKTRSKPLSHTAVSRDPNTNGSCRTLEPNLKPSLIHHHCTSARRPPCSNSALLRILNT